MKSRLIRVIVSLVVFVGMSAGLVALTWQPPASVDAASEHEDDHADHVKATHEHAGREPAVSLLVDERLDTPCEHNVAIVECDECRYEAGVAKISPELAAGLVEAWSVRTEQRPVRRLNLTGEVQFDLTQMVEIASPVAARME